MARITKRLKELASIIVSEGMGREYVYILDVANHEMEEGEEYTYDEYAIASEWIDKKLGL